MAYPDREPLYRFILRRVSKTGRLDRRYGGGREGTTAWPSLGGIGMDLRDALGIFGRDVKYALRSLARAKGLTITVIFTLALGIGANAAIFTLVRGVLLRPLVNRDEDRLIYIRQSARGLGTENAVFSVPEIDDLKKRIKTLSAIGDFSTIG